MSDEEPFQRTFSHNVIAASVVGAGGCALVALFSGAAWVAVIIVCAWFLGVVAGLHIHHIQHRVYRTCDPLPPSDRSQT